MKASHKLVVYMDTRSLVEAFMSVITNRSYIALHLMYSYNIGIFKFYIALYVGITHYRYN